MEEIKNYFLTFFFLYFCLSSREVNVDGPIFFFYHACSLLVTKSKNTCKSKIKVEFSQRQMWNARNMYLKCEMQETCTSNVKCKKHVPQMWNARNMYLKNAF